MNNSDCHNFGKRVEKVQRASGAWFQKPRTVFWEWFFFGKTSPLAEVFSSVGKNSEKPLADFLFNLDIEINSAWLGYAREVVETKDQELLSSHFYGFGVLLAYSYIFGIRDLHRENLVLTETHLQVVDAEVVLTKLVLPNETILLPFKNVGYEFAGIGRLLPSPELLSQDQAKALFAGYFDFFDCAINKKDAIAHALSDAKMSQHPVRVILRNTSEYTNLESLDLMASEESQLKRGDIPYYFKRVGNVSVNWMSSQSIFSEESILPRFVSDMNRHAVNPLSLLETNLASPKVMIQGALHLIRHFKYSSASLSFLLNQNIKVDFANSLVEVDAIIYSIA